MKKRKEAMKWWDKYSAFDKQLICSAKFGTDRKYTSLKSRDIVGLYEDFLSKSQ